ncbi:MAG: hypothetical protein AAGB15_15520 [Pseudomonadota bacterium]
MESHAFGRQLDLQYSANAPGSYPAFRLPNPLEFAITYKHGQPRIEGFAVAASRDISLRASGGFKSREEGLRGNVSIVFKF